MIILLTQTHEEILYSKLIDSELDSEFWLIGCLLYFKAISL